MSALRSVPLLLLLGALLVAACQRPEAAPEGSPAAEAAEAEAGRAVPVEAITVAPEPFEERILLTGTVEAPEDAILSAEAAGTLRSLLPLGRAVARGQVVAEIDPGLARAALRQAEAALEAARAQAALAEDQFRRQEPLVRDSIISPLEFEGVRANRAAARAQVAQAEAQVAQARENLARTRIVAPFPGTVEEHLARRGEQVSPGVPVVRVVAGGGLKVRAGVPERYAADIRVGTPVVVTPQAYVGAPQRGTVAFVGRAVDPQNRTFPIEVQLPASEALKPQMVVRLEVTRRTLEDALVVPLSAVVRDEDGATVYVVEEERGRTVARVRRIGLGPSDEGRVVVTSGLAPGDRVITQGQTTVADGEPVRVTGPGARVAPALLPE